MGRGSSDLKAMPRPFSRSATQLIIHNYGADRFFAEPPSLQRLAGIAKEMAYLGQLINAQYVNADFENDVHAFASSDGVSVHQVSADLPMAEHPSILAPARRQLIDNTPIRVASEKPREAASPLNGALDFLRQVKPTFLRVEFEDGRELVADGSQITLTHSVPRKLFGNRRELLEKLSRPEDTL